MVTGEKPFPGQNIPTVIYKIVNEDPVPPRQIDPSIHPGISVVVMRALEKEPDQRYQNCREMLEDLRKYRTLAPGGGNPQSTMRSEEHTSELQSRLHLVCRLLLEKKTTPCITTIRYL